MENQKEMTFEAAIAELQTVVEKLEAGKVALAESLALYERGVALVKICNERLDAAEQRVRTVRLDGGEPRVEGIDGEVAQ